METIATLIYPRRTIVNKLGQSPVNIRVTINGQRIDISTGKSVDAKQWSADLEGLTGRSSEVKEINSFFELLRSKVLLIEQKYLKRDEPLTPEAFRKEWFGLKDGPRMLLEIFQVHNDEVEQLINKQYSKATWKKYKTSLKHTKDFLKDKYELKDIELKDIKYKFITDFEFWLKTSRNCNHNSTIKYLTNFNKIIGICLKNSWIEKDPFIGFKMSKQDVLRHYLTEHELEAIASKEFHFDRLRQVRDIFLFCCYTGLAYADIQKLSRSEIAKGVNDQLWIFTQRLKTETASRIPLLPPAIQILNRYNDHPECIAKDKILPVPSNQKMNAYLKEIADLCGINKHLTTHIARHTFATTITLTNGVPFESVSKMLGHKNLRTTQQYAKILDKKVGDDMSALMKKYKALESKE